MADDKVKGYDRHGEKITVDKSEIGKLYALGGKLATKAEIASHDLEKQYEQTSTVSKVAGAVMGAGALPPTIEAWRRGGIAGLTGGFGEVGIKEAADALQHGAGKAYVDQTDQLKEAHPTAYAAGEVGGMIGGAIAGSAAGAGGAGLAARALPSAGIGAIGGAVESGIGRALSGVAARGVLGRAGVTAAELGARGLVEGGLGAASQYTAEQIAHDREIQADKLFAATGTGALYGLGGGAVLGGAGSLAASGARAAGGALASAARSGLARVMAPAEEALAGAEVRAATQVATDAVAEGGTLSSTVNSRMKGLANEMAFDALGATKGQAKNALEYVQGGAQAVGEYINRVGIAKAAEGSGLVGGAVKAGMQGRADDLLAAIQADKGGRIAEGLSASVKGTPARFSVEEIAKRGGEIHEAMLRDPTKIAGADAFLNRVKLEAEAIHNAGKVGADGTIDAAEAFYLRSDMAKQAYELGKASGSAGDAYKQYLREWDKLSIQALDEAAEKAGKSGLGDEIRHWKREWQLASAAEELAQHGADRVLRNNVFGLREGIGAAVGFATGSPLTGMATAFGGKVLRERGSAMAASALSQMADSGLLARWVQKVDQQIGKASKGLLQAPTKGLLKPADKMPATKLLAKTALQRVAEFKSDPEAFVDKATRQSEAVAAHDPELASALVQRQVQGLSFLAEKVPVTPDPDPLDPHPAPKMTASEQAELGRYAWYVEKPDRFFKEVSRGKLTFEGAEVAQRLMPGAFAELQQRTADELASQMAKGSRLPYRQRQLLGVLLDFAATPSQRPEHASFLQQNVSSVLPSEEPPKGAPAKARPVSMPTQRSALDRLEADGPGRR